MPGYRYRATGPDGKPLRGVIEARDLEDAKLRLTGRGWNGVQVTEAKLPQVREAATLDAPPRRGGLVTLLILLLLLVAALAALVWFDPWHLGLLEQYGLPSANS